MRTTHQKFFQDLQLEQKMQEQQKGRGGKLFVGRREKESSPLCPLQGAPLPNVPTREQTTAWATASLCFSG